MGLDPVVMPPTTVTTLISIAAAIVLLLIQRSLRHRCASLLRAAAALLRRPVDAAARGADRGRERLRHSGLLDASRMSGAIAAGLVTSALFNLLAEILRYLAA